MNGSTCPDGWRREDMYYAGTACDFRTDTLVGFQITKVVLISISTLIFSIQTPRVVHAFMSNQRTKEEKTKKYRSSVLVHCSLLVFCVCQIIASAARLTCMVKQQPTNTSVCFSYWYGSWIVRLVVDGIPAVLFEYGTNVFLVTLIRAFVLSSRVRSALVIERKVYVLLYAFISFLACTKVVVTFTGVGYTSESVDDALTTLSYMATSLSVFAMSVAFVVYGRMLEKEIRRFAQDENVRKTATTIEQVSMLFFNLGFPGCVFIALVTNTAFPRREVFVMSIWIVSQPPMWFVAYSLRSTANTSTKDDTSSGSSDNPNSPNPKTGNRNFKDRDKEHKGHAVQMQTTQVIVQPNKTNTAISQQSEDRD